MGEGIICREAWNHASTNCSLRDRGRHIFPADCPSGLKSFGPIPARNLLFGYPVKWLRFVFCISILCEQCGGQDPMTACVASRFERSKSMIKLINHFPFV